MNVGIIRLCLLMILVFALLLYTSCGKEKPAQGKKPVQAVSEYSPDSVFVEVKKKLQDNPRDVDAWFHLADLYERNGQYTEAIEAYKKVVELKPDMGYAYVKMGTAYDRLDKPADAIREFKRAIKYMPNYAVAYNNLGIAYGKLGKVNDEIAALKKAVKLRPAYTSAVYNLGMAYLKAKNKKAAMQQYESLKKFDEGAANDLLKEINKGAS